MILTGKAKDYFLVWYFNTYLKKDKYCLIKDVERFFESVIPTLQNTLIIDFFDSVSITIGIEDNNGWISIKSEDDLPKEEIDVHFIFKNSRGNFQTFGVWDNKLKNFYSGALKITNVTHYQPITKPKPPLYD